MIHTRKKTPHTPPAVPGTPGTREACPVQACPAHGAHGAHETLSSADEAAQTYSAPARNGDSTAVRTAAAAGARETSGLSRDNRLADGWGPKERQLSRDNPRSDVGNSQLSADNRPFCVPLSVALWVTYPSKSAVLRWDRGSFWLAELATPQSCIASKRPARTNKRRKIIGNPPPERPSPPVPFRERVKGRVYDPRNRAPRTASTGVTRIASAAPAPLEAPSGDTGGESPTEVKQRAARRKDERSPGLPSTTGPVRNRGPRTPEHGHGRARAADSVRRWAVPTTLLSRVNP